MRRLGFILLFGLLAACSQAETRELETAEPTTAPTIVPTATPTLEPTPMPTNTPTLSPMPTEEPLPTPTEVPTNTFSTDNDIKSALTLYSAMPVIEREEENRYLNGGAVISHDGEFHMFSNFFDSWPGRTVTYYYTSPDGQTWTRIGEEPLFTISDMPFNETGALVLDGLVQPDGTWTLYFHTFSSSNRPGFIGRATAESPEGPWMFDETAVLLPGSEGEWDDLQVMRVNVLPTEDGFVMYYAGVNQAKESRIGMAFSADGIAWEKYDDPMTTAAPYAESDPILEPEFDWEGSSLGRPEVVQTADGWVMLYEGAPGSKTGLAVSEDGIHFKRYEANPILTRDNIIARHSFFQGALFHENDVYYYLIEAGNGAVGTDIYLYTIEGSLFAD